MVCQDIREVKIGNVAQCRAGRLGVVYKIVAKRGHKVRELYAGIGLDGKPWQSNSPHYIAESVNHYMQKVKQDEARTAKKIPLHERELI